MSELIQLNSLQPGSIHLESGYDFGLGFSIDKATLTNIYPCFIKPLEIQVMEYLILTSEGVDNKAAQANLRSHYTALVSRLTAIQVRLEIAYRQLYHNPVLIKGLKNITTAQCNAITWAERRHPGITNDLWRLNVIQGEKYLVQGHAFPFMSDVGDTFLRLAKVDILRPIKFAPSLSGAAFLGLQKGAHRESRKAPHAGDAGHWSWEVIGTFDILAMESR